MKHPAKQWVDYHVWANQRIINRLKELPEGVYHQEIQSVFPSISEVMVHMYVTDVLWLDVMSGQDREETMTRARRTSEETKGKGLEELEKLFADLSVKYRDFLDSQEDLDRPLLLEHPQAGRLKTRLSQAVLHVVNHGTYHRVNITAMLRQQGHAGVMTDFVAYLYEAGEKTQPFGLG
ncbi:DinB family protein [Kroppenstedtia eburnea]|uniref:DinB family protein n=1 Tax=Kroppenstedtia eburnea TaxID=714067 RepID=UPI003634E726